MTATVLALLLLLASLVRSQQQFAASPFLTSGNSLFGTYIEGAAVDSAGTVYAVNYGGNNDRASIGSVSPQSPFFSLRTAATTSAFNGIRFSSTGTVYVADPVGRRVLAGSSQGLADARSICQEPGMIDGVPNDIAITTDGRFLFVSGMRYTANTSPTDGQLWICDAKKGRAKLLMEMGRTNGIEVSPDNTALYISEAFNQNSQVVSNMIWRFDLDAASGAISNQRLFVDFTALDGSGGVDVDGMRTDIMGNLFVARNGGGEVAKFDATGTLVAKIKVSMKYPTNLEFGGVTGTTLFIVGRCESSAFGDGAGCVDTFQSDMPGRAFTELQMLAGAQPAPAPAPPPAASSISESSTPAQTSAYLSAPPAQASAPSSPTTLKPSVTTPTSPQGATTPSTVNPMLTNELSPLRASKSSILVPTHWGIAPLLFGFLYLL
ncbi:calcium-dependent phosphotriesterase [Gonapodya prolifera JEL478]|uniref:Calcium-dependent phosphotriesterase n=1 Tax=Gonapodya prolifera (strain JEL478) TaxID=1344416 RepID=A0A139AVB1_GONPJ|nr:calcium-dependent phosphotriesterase [Gonapodya prolifera JEL478]|eukprot:KXS20686.1 calcium-dependent phosphotriesterase [Gonapodya prolifera JEL478]